jgi:hypothetical protein
MITSRTGSPKASRTMGGNVIQARNPRKNMLFSERHSDASSSGTSRMVRTQSAKRWAPVPGSEDGAGRDGPEADEECPACQETELVLHGVCQRQETFLIAYGRAGTEEQLRPDDQHRHHEQGG